MSAPSVPDAVAERDMQPLHIVARLAEPVVYFGDGMTFDGILAAAMMRDLPYEVTSKWPTATRDEPWLVDLHLPLGRWRCFYEHECEPRLRDAEGLVWGWRASSVFARWDVVGRAEVRKPAPMDAHSRWGTGYEVNASAGRFKAHDIKLPSRFAKELHWFAFGRQTPIQRLLTRHVSAVGRKVGHGHGRVLEWRVEPWHEDWSVQVGERLSRPMPHGFCRPSAGDAVARRGIRAPYWHPSRQVVCVVPGDLQMEGT
jgi:CRISPR type IV-associated protein Csf3